MKKFLLCLMALLCLITATTNISYAAKSQPLTEEQQKEVDAFAGYIEHLMDIRSYSQACAMAYELTRRYPNEPLGYFLLGMARNDSGYYEPAIKAYDDCIKVDKTYYKAYFNRGLAKYHLKQYKEAIADYNKVLKLKITKTDRAVTYSNRALTKYFDGDLKGALKDYNKVFELEPNLKTIDTVYFNRGLCRYDLGDKAGADEDYKKAKELNPKRKYIYYDQRGQKIKKKKISEIKDA